MIILHAGIYYGSPVLWAEVSDVSSPDTHQSKNRLLQYKFSANPAQLKKILKQIPVKLKTLQYAGIWLPTKDGNPIPSSSIISDTVYATKPKLEKWGINIAILDDEQVIGLLGRLVGMRTIMPGMIVGADLAYLVEVMHLASSLVARQQYLPNMRDEGGSCDAVWSPILVGADSEQFNTLEKRMPGAIVAFTNSTNPTVYGLPSKTLESILTAFIGYLVRLSASDSNPNVSRRRQRFDSIHDSWMHHLKFEDTMNDEDAPVFTKQVHKWQQSLIVTTNMPLRLCFRLEEPEKPGDPWFVRYMVQSRNDPSFLISAEDAWNSKTNMLPSGTNIKEFLLISIAKASGIFPHITTGLKKMRLELGKGCFIDINAAHDFLTKDAPALRQAGYGIILPSWWKGNGTQAKIRARGDIKNPKMKTRGIFDLNSIVEFDWQIAIGDNKVTLTELNRLANAKVPLVHMRGQWVQVSPEEIKQIIKFLKKKTKKSTLLEAIKMGLGGEFELVGTLHENNTSGIDVEIQSKNKDISKMLNMLTGKAKLEKMKQPKGFTGKLRPYQNNGFSWLYFLQRWGLGGCLADDMGLGKTIQTLALIQQYRSESGSKKNSAFLLVCPTSVISNWEKEAHRFTPELSVMIHHGVSRNKTASSLQRKIGNYDIVISSYGLLQKDVKVIKKIKWAGLVLDEAQNIKNWQTKQAQAARAIDAKCRFALTGTPVENNIGDLWSIMEFLNPGFLGNQASFKRNFFVPIQTRQDENATNRLKQATAPFILRRLKTDKSIIADLPEKMENKTYCSLTKEQASLYAAVLKDIEISLAASEGIQRKGIILSALVKLKQVCNHPVLLLKDNSGITTGRKRSDQMRSGKLASLTEMLAEIIEMGESALVFTQFVEMGHMLRLHIQETFGQEVRFLHGGTTRQQRDQMVQWFQNEQKGISKILVISLKAGGTGLNLTAASHVFHFDRWWNPAVEDQATDRAFRIGQKKNVQVHKMICTGTLEEKIDMMIERKKYVSKKVIGTGEGWITEMSNDDLRNILALSAEATLGEEDQ